MKILFKEKKKVEINFWKKKKRTFALSANFEFSEITPF